VDEVLAGPHLDKPLTLPEECSIRFCIEVIKGDEVAQLV
jgi:hypothetical protein